MPKPKILYLCDFDPRVHDNGNAQRTHLLWQALKTVGEVYVLCEEPPLDETDDHIRQLRYSEQTAFNKLADRIWESTIGRLAPKVPDLDFRPIPPVTSRDFHYAGMTFDYVVSRYYNRLGRLHPWRWGRLYVDVDDHPLQVFETRAVVTNPIARFFSRCFLRAVLRFYDRKIEGGWVANPAQTSWCAFKKPCGVLTNQPLTGESRYEPSAQACRTLATIGVMGYEPNYQGVDYFLETIWPKIRARYPDLRYVIAGRHAPEACAARWNATPGVRYVGFAEDLDAFYRDSTAMIVPVLTGGGTCIKTLEALAHGRVCLATTFGARGLAAPESAAEAGLKSFDTAEEFLNLFETTVASADTRWACERKGPKYIQDHYSRTSFESSVRAAFERADG